MLIEFSVTNFRSFAGKQTLSLVASKDTTLQDYNTFEPCKGLKGARVLRSAVLYGANASGKSNLLKAMNTLSYWVRHSLWPRKMFFPTMAPFKLGDSDEAPCEFEIVVFIDNVRYHYGLSAKQDCIYREWLVCYPDSRPQRWFEREYRPDTDSYDWWFGPKFAGGRSQHQVWRDSTRKDALFLTTSVSLNCEQLRKFYNWLSYLRVLGLSGTGSTHDMTSEGMFQTDKEEYAVLTDFVRKADLGIDRLELKKYESEEGLREETILAWHKTDNGEKAFDFSDEESDGTRQLFRLAGPWRYSLKYGLPLFIDELDRSLHPMLTRFLIEFFNSPQNTKNAQLIFTTHNTSLLAPDLFRRDQIWFAEKDKKRATQLYSLLDYSPRKDEAWERGYLTGRYGAIPVIGQWKW